MATEHVYHEVTSDEENVCINAQSGYIRPSDIHNIRLDSDYMLPIGDEYPQQVDGLDNKYTVEPASASHGNLSFEHFDDPIGVANTQQPRARVSVPQTQDKPAGVPMCRQPKACWPVMTVILLSLVALGLVILGVNVHLQLERLVSNSVE